MKLLKDILYKSGIEEVIGSTDITISSIEVDSRSVEKSCVFVAIKGLTSDGHNYIKQVIKDKAVAVVCEHFPSEIKEGITYIKVKDTREAIANMASNFYGNPSSKLKLVGITGTNGKTTTATLLYSLFNKLGYTTGLISTVVNYVGKNEYKATHTTPDVLELNSLLAKMVEQGCDYCFMEVSSHAIDQNRIEGIEYSGAVFTNISHDHLDYHKNFKEYIRVKKLLFDGLSNTAFALYNSDDRNGQIMVQNTKAKTKSFAIKDLADFRLKILENNISGLVLRIAEHEICVKLTGQFNAYNLLTVYAVATILEQEQFEVLKHLSTLESVSGRFQWVKSKNEIIGIVDYAHTPDALENVLSTIRDIRNQGEQIITVVGCGGDRDVEKRPVMAKVASDLSSRVIFTSDNPRSEDPQAIIDDMKLGLGSNHTKVISILNRKEAIRTACSLAQRGDVILVAGKGHEKYQESNGVKTPFDDMQILVNELKIQAS